MITSANAPDSALPGSAARDHLRSKRSGHLGDRVFHALTLACALSLFGFVLLLLGVLLQHSALSIHAFGWSFLSRSLWNPVAKQFGALPFLYGTLLSSLLAVAIAVPLSLCSAIFLLEICPAWMRGAVSFLIELLAAIPSIVYGLWGIFVLVPLVRNYAGPALIAMLGWTGLFREPNFGVNTLTAALILAIMIVPIVSSISRDLLRAVPDDQREAVLALGGTRWEMVRIGLLGNSWLGITGAVLLGLGRALGETMAVTMVIGNHAEITRNLLAPSYTLASVLANEFAEAIGHLYLASLMEIAVVLLLLTALVNLLARLLVWAATSRAGRGMRRTA